jgi:hypothetical protein
MLLEQRELPGLSEFLGTAMAPEMIANSGWLKAATFILVASFSAKAHAQANDAAEPGPPTSDSAVSDAPPSELMSPAGAMAKATLPSSHPSDDAAERRRIERMEVVGHAERGELDVGLDCFLVPVRRRWVSGHRDRDCVQ